MSLSILLESLKFYKMKQERTVQIWFVLLYALNVAIYILPFSDTDFNAFYTYLNQLLSGEIAAIGSVTPQSILTTLTPGNWAFVGMSLLMNLVCLFFGLLYATLYAGQLTGLLPRQALVRCLAALPRLLLVMLLLLFPAIASCYLLGIPLVIMLLMMYFLPLGLTIDRQKLPAAMQASFFSTRGQRVAILVMVVLLSLLISLPRGLILNIVSLGILPVALVASFFTVLLTFVQARLMGILYLLLVKKDPSVLPSRANS